MKRLVAGALAVWLAGSAGGLGCGVATAAPDLPTDTPWTAPTPTPPPVGDASNVDVVYAVGGARPPGIPWADYTRRAGSGYFPNKKREIIDYPAGAMFRWVPTMFAPDAKRDNMTVAAAVDAATDSLHAVIRRGSEPASVIGLSQGTMALDKEQVRLANDPAAPPPHMLQFTTIGSPMGKHAFGASFLSGLFPPGSRLPLDDYVMPPEVDSQYDTNRIVAAYDGMADFPDRPDNLWSVTNALLGAAIVHTPSAFTTPADVPPQNIRSTINSRGATTTTYLIPINHLPLTLPLRFLGMPDDVVDQLDAFLQPQIDAGYSRNDNPATRPISVSPAGMDVVEVLGPETSSAIDDTVGKLRNFFGFAG
ncbi:PE-PPE domain-containing protein [Mycolicibacter hiberniae]|uniref:PE-PPE domain-containing protein n=1 Tax=Mycolicibacter hiberniae TaxID=29314 RepID=A0A7I7X616_9MYCO|nr:PE-PPE domain-containing protein [Mycolicibacter hiberniae]MCV7088310.1 PE-PPE domain-containing protein [Mycolicibacter hiberniae]ORV68853.1 PE-PPE domain-containing protein [Mycolicibacter hiberniae]BBZ25166.1 PE-PPE domain-containing protein [Mycolicibacter hiberniae]